MSIEELTNASALPALDDPYPLSEEQIRSYRENGHIVLRGVAKPQQCEAFGTICTPEHPLGATMVSNEGACAAYYQYRRRELKTQSANAGSAAD